MKARNRIEKGDEAHQLHGFRREIDDRQQDRDHDEPRRVLERVERGLQKPAQRLGDRVEHHLERILDAEKAGFDPLGQVAGPGNRRAGLVQRVERGKGQLPDGGALTAARALGEQVGHAHRAGGRILVAPLPQAEPVEDEIICRHVGSPCAGPWRALSCLLGKRGRAHGTAPPVWQGLLDDAAQLLGSGVVHPAFQVSLFCVRK